MKRLVSLALCLSLLIAPLPALASDVDGGAVMADVLLARPLGVFGVVFGSALFVVSLPFTIPSGSVKKSADLMIRNPFLYTFHRPLADFDYEVDNSPVQP